MAERVWSEKDLVRRSPWFVRGGRVVAFSVRSGVSVSLAARGQADMRGLVTAGRDVRQEWVACLGSSAAPSIEESFVGGAAHRGVAGRGLLLLHDGQGPT